MGQMICFTLFGVPTHIHLSFWLAVGLWGVALTGCEPHPVGVLLFGVAALVALLVHEIGHALMGHWLTKTRVEVCLSFLGGQCCLKEETECTWLQNILIVLAGPLAGLAPVGALAVWLYVTTQSVSGAWALGSRMLQGEVPLEYVGTYPPLLLLLLVYVLQISCCWTALNLLPIYPLDGGLLLRDLLPGSDKAYGISLIATLLLSMLFIAVGIWALAVLMFVLAYYNYRCLQVSSE